MTTNKQLIPAFNDTALSLTDCNVTNVSLQIPESASVEEWLAIGETLQQCDNGLMWWIGDWLNFGESRYGETYSQALDATDYKQGTLQNAKWVASKWETSLRNEVCGWHHHRIALSADDPKGAIEWAVANGQDGKPASVLRLREYIRDSKIGDLNPAPPVGKYHVIVIDPPWEMEKIEREVAPNQVGFDYPTMSEESLAEFDVLNFAADDCHLFCWTTHKHLPMALRLLETWGFKYIMTMVWHKPGGFQPFGLPQYNCEFVLYARRGSPKFIDTSAFPACFNAPRTGHSVKPDEFYALINRVTDGPRIDVFNRRQIDGFESWGNES